MESSDEDEDMLAFNADILSHSNGDENASNPLNKSGDRVNTTGRLRSSSVITYHFVCTESTESNLITAVHIINPHLLLANVISWFTGMLSNQFSLMVQSRPTTVL